MPTHNQGWFVVPYACTQPKPTRKHLSLHAKDPPNGFSMLGKHNQDQPLLLHACKWPRLTFAITQLGFVILRPHMTKTNPCCSMLAHDQDRPKNICYFVPKTTPKWSFCAWQTWPRLTKKTFVTLGLHICLPNGFSMPTCPHKQDILEEENN